jgi:hypothetical protein
MNHYPFKQLSIARTNVVGFVVGLLLISAATSQAAVLYSCPGAGTAGDNNTRGFYMTNFPGVTLDSATLNFVGSVAGTYQISLTVRSNAYDGLILGASTITLALNSVSGASKYATFPFADVPMPKRGTVCFILAVVSGPYPTFYYDVGGDCPGVIETEDTSAPLSTFRRLGVDLTITGASDELYSCSPGIGGDDNSRGFYVTNFPGVTLDSATLKLIGSIAGTYQITLAAYSNAYNGPILGTSTVTVALNNFSGDFVSTEFPFPDAPMPNGGTVCFILSVGSGPYPYIYYDVGGGCSGAIETEDTTPPLSIFRRLGVDLTLLGTPTLQLNISRSGNVVSVFWQNVLGWNLQQNANLNAPAGWSPSGGVVTSSGTNYLNLASPPANMFFRLKNP